MSPICPDRRAEIVLRLVRRPHDAAAQVLAEQDFTTEEKYPLMAPNIRAEVWPIA